MRQIIKSKKHIRVWNETLLMKNVSRYFLLGIQANKDCTFLNAKLSYQKIFHTSVNLFYLYIASSLSKVVSNEQPNCHIRDVQKMFI